MILFPWLGLIVLGTFMNTKNRKTKRVVDFKHDEYYEDLWKNCGF